MLLLFQIIIDVIFPIFILLGIGALLHRLFSFDMNTLSKVTTYFLLPAVAFVNIYKSNISIGVLLEILSFLILQSVSLMVLCAIIVRIYKFEPGMDANFKNTVVLVNSGNYGLPVSQLVFHSNPLGQSIQVIVMIFQNLLTYTYGLFNSVSTQTSSLKAVVELLKLPIIYALLLGFVLNHFNIVLPTFIWNPIDNISSAFLAIALLTLGAQVAYLKITHITIPLVLGISGRLIVSPCIAFLIIFMLGIEGSTAQALLIASSFPVSRNSALFALEYNNHPDYAAQAVFLSTLLSGVTVTAVIYLAGILF